MLFVVPALYLPVSALAPQDRLYAFSVSATPFANNAFAAGSAKGQEFGQDCCSGSFYTNDCRVGELK